MICISIGTNCVPRAQIDKYFTQPKQSHFFDKTYENFSCVIKVMKNLERPNDFLLEEDFIVTKKIYINTKLKWLLPHEINKVPHIIKTNFTHVELNQSIQTYETHIPAIIKTYIDKMDKLKTTIQNNNKIVFLHYISEESLTPHASLINFVTENALSTSMSYYFNNFAKSFSQFIPQSLDIGQYFSSVPYFPTIEDCNDFLQSVKNINEDCDAHLFFVILPEIKCYDRANLLRNVTNTHVHFLTKTDDNSEGWMKSGYDWKVVFEKMEFF